MRWVTDASIHRVAIRKCPFFLEGWQTVLTPDPGDYQYRIPIEGEWRNHAEATRRTYNSYGTENCVLKVN